MIAIDTNVVIRYLVNDDRDQARRARTIILDALEALFGLAMVRVEDEAAVLRAVTDARAGMDFAAALHVASAPPGADQFLTFDRALGRTRSKGMRVKLVPT